MRIARNLLPPRFASPPAFSLIFGARRIRPADRSRAAIDFARPRVVKLYGDAAGREHGYGVGVIVSADGKIATTTAVMLESAGLRAVLNDGRRFPAKVIARDETHQLALLQIDGDQLTAFELGTSETMQPGDWVLTAGNPFKVADGPEPVSFMRGVFSGRADLAARRRAQDVAYPGQVLLLDAIVSTPGQAGGRVVDAAGRLVGLIGKSVESTRTNTFLNYPIPVETVADFVSAAASGNWSAADPTAEHNVAAGRSGHSRFRCERPGAACRWSARWTFPARARGRSWKIRFFRSAASWSERAANMPTP